MLLDAELVQVDAVNDLALLKANAEGRMKNEEIFKPLSIAASRTVLEPTHVGCYGGRRQVNGRAWVGRLCALMLPSK
jgi:hypothetical protein